MAFWSAARRWAERAVAAGVLTLDQIQNGSGKAYTLLPGVESPAQISEPPNPTPVAPAERSGDAEELLADVLIALLEQPGDAWDNFAAALPEELFYRVDRHLDTLLGPAAST
jgi:hypothetical protein